MNSSIAPINQKGMLDGKEVVTPTLCPKYHEILLIVYMDTHDNWPKQVSVYNMGVLHFILNANSSHLNLFLISLVK